MSKTASSDSATRLQRKLLFLVSKRVGLVIILTFFFMIPYHIISAQKATSLCVVTEVGNPSVPPSLPAGCNGLSAGNYHNPLVKPGQAIDSIILGISTEMASYAGAYQFEGHSEHAGLDLITEVGKKPNVYAITDGVIEEWGGNAETCAGIYAGCSVSLIHDEDGLISRYTHINPSVKKGDRVKKGQLLGVVHVWPDGNDHLHFELIRKDNLYNINPRNYFPELQIYPPSPGYIPTVREHSANRNLPLTNDGKEWAETYLNHPPCVEIPAENCWAR